MKCCFVCNQNGRLMYTYGGGRFETICAENDACREIISRENWRAHADFLSKCEAIFCTWDMVDFTEAEIAEIFPSLKVVFYAAGSVRYFAEPFLKRGVRVLSAWQAMARPVADFATALITLGNKGALGLMELYKQRQYERGHDLAHHAYPGTYQVNVGVLGAGAIGSLVIERLRDLDCNPMVYDPFLNAEKARSLNIARTYSLQEIFANCQTVSNHLANNPQTEGMLNYELFKLMPKCGVFINTGRGAQVVEADLCRALNEEPLRQAYLDVTWPEPAQPDSPLYRQPNAFLFPHMAGVAASEVYLLSDAMIARMREYNARAESDKAAKMPGEVTLDMLATMA